VPSTTNCASGARSCEAIKSMSDNSNNAKDTWRESGVFRNSVTRGQKQSLGSPPAGPKGRAQVGVWRKSPPPQKLKPESADDRANFFLQFIYFLIDIVQEEDNRRKEIMKNTHNTQYAAIRKIIENKE